MRAHELGQPLTWIDNGRSNWAAGPRTGDEAAALPFVSTIANLQNSMPVHAMGAAPELAGAHLEGRARTTLDELGSTCASGDVRHHELCCAVEAHASRSRAARRVSDPCRIVPLTRPTVGAAPTYQAPSRCCPDVVAVPVRPRAAGRRAADGRGTRLDHLAVARRPIGDEELQARTRAQAAVA